MLKKFILFLSKFSLPKNLFITRIFTLMLCLCLFISLFHFQNVYSLHGISSILYTNFKFWVNDFISAINILYRYLDTLTLHQEGALFNLIILISILSNLFSILGIFFGNEIIKYFKIENKYPWLRSFLLIRAKFQRYYLMWNIFMLFVFCLFGIGINLLAFFVG